MPSTPQTSYDYGELSTLEITYKGETNTLRQWSSLLDSPYPTLRVRYMRGKRDPADLLGPLDLRGRKRVQRPTVAARRAEVAVRISQTFLDDLLGPETMTAVREIAKRTNFTPIEVVRKIVKKRAIELLQPENK